MQPSFAGGEFGPAMRRRTDFAKYQVAADTMENLIVLPQGGFQSRTGTKFIYAAKDSTYTPRLVPFTFSITQSYMLEFGDYYMRVYKGGGIITSDGTTPYVLTTPFPIADVWDLKFEQSADTLFVIHPSYQKRLITRTGHAAWTVSVADEENSPLMSENTTSTTLTLSNTAGDTLLLEDASVTVTASSSVFNSAHVGSIWAIRYRAYTNAERYSASNAEFTSSLFRCIGDWTVTAVSAGYLNGGDFTIYKSVDDGASWFKIKLLETAALISAGSSSEVTGSEDDLCYLKVHRAAGDNSDSGNVTVDIDGQYMWGYFKITAVSSSTVATATLLQDFSGGGTAYKTWAEGCWSDYRGWPRAGTFFQNRWMSGGNTYGPNTYWASVVDDYHNNVVSISQVEDEGINDRLPSRQVNAIEWMVPSNDLIVLTSDSEWSISPSSTSGVFSYKSKIVHQRTATGASANCKPVIIGDSVVYLKRGSNKVQGLGYSDSTGYVSSELSVLADHLFSDYTITDWAYQQNPHSILWCVRSDGTLLSFTYMKEQDVIAWTHHVTDGKFEAVGCIPGDTQDEVYFVVNRTVNGSTVRYIEMLAERDITDGTTYIGLDSSLTGTRTTASTTVSNLTHLIGKSVKVIADGVDVGYKTVSSTGTITLDKAATNVIVGLEFDWLFKSLSIDSGIDRKKVINSVTVSVIESKGGMAGIDEDSYFNTLPYPQTDYYTGDLADVNMNASYEYDGRVVLKGSGANPFWCIAITPKVTSGGN